MSQNIVDYCIGLDLGTGSVGWAVVDMNHRLMKRNGKHLWGSRLLVMQKQQQHEDLADLYVEDTIREERELDYYVLFYRIWS